MFCRKGKRIWSAFLTMLLAANLTAQPDATAKYRSQVLGLPSGTRIDVRLKGGERLKGTLVSATDKNFVIGKVRKGATASTTVSFDQVEALSIRKPTHTPVVAWIAAGGIAAAVGIGLAIFFTERHNEGH